MTSAHDHEVEAQRQQALLAALVARDASPSNLVLRESPARALQGLGAYRGNASATAARALTAVYPTVAQMIGHDDFEHLAHDYWRAHPPTCGDLGEWGEALPGWLDAFPDFAAWPYLADAARLDLALHRCERAADAEFDSASLAMLSQAEPTQLRMGLIPGGALIESRWPIATMHAAHQPDGGAFDAVREAIEQQIGETVLVARQGWRARVFRLDAAEARWVSQLLSGATLDRALDAAGEGFDFAAWLARAVQERWLKGIESGGDETALPHAGDTR